MDSLLHAEELPSGGFSGVEKALPMHSPPNHLPEVRVADVSPACRLTHRVYSEGEEKVHTMQSLDWSMLVHGKLYDREHEKEQLLSSFQRIVSGTGPPELVLITGRSGNGKTALAKSLKESIRKENGLLVSGKFDQLQRPSDGLRAFVQAFTEYVQCIIESHPINNTREKVRQNLVESLGHNEQVLLTQMIPSLSDLLAHERRSSGSGATQNSSDRNTMGQTDMTGFEAQRRFQFVFRSFMRAICSVENPLVLFLDDLQWAPKEALDLLAALLMDQTIRGFVILGACRGNEMSIDDSLSVMLRKLEDNYELYVTNIEVNSFSTTAVEHLLSDLLHLPASNCRLFAQAIHGHTSGNPFFTLQFLRSLSEFGMIHVTEDTVNVDYSNLSSLFTYTGNQDIEGLICTRIQQLPTELQQVMKIAASLGASFDKEVVDRIFMEQTEKSDSSEYLAMGVKEGFMAPNVAAQETKSTSATATSYAFVHDRVQEAAYHMIQDKPDFHISIFRSLLNSYSSEELLGNAPILANQLCQGIDLIQDENDRTVAAQLCWHAGKHAIEESSFQTASTYFGAGRRLLGRRPWRLCYDLTLSLFSISAEVEYAIGNVKLTSDLVDEVLANANCLNDKILAYRTRIYALGTQHRMKEAIDVALAVLRQLQEPFPRNAKTRHVIWNVIRTSASIRNMSDQDILNLKPMEDPHKLAVMNVLNAVFVSAFCTEHMLTPLVVLRMVQITLKHGLCVMSAFGFAAYGFLLCSMNQIEEGVRFADLSMQIIQHFKISGGAWFARVNTLCHIFCYPSKHALRFSHQPLLKAYRSGLATGDTEFAMFSVQFSCHVAMYSSQPLNEVFQNMLVCREVFTNYNQPTIKAYLDVLLQVVANLMGQSPKNQGKPSRLDGEYVVFEETIRYAQLGGEDMLLAESYGLNLVLAYFVGDLSWALHLHEKWRREVDEKMIMHFALRLIRLFDGLTLLGVANDDSVNGHQRRRHLRQAKKILQHFRQDAVVSPRNCLKNLYLLEAEYTIVAHNNLEEGLEKFATAIDLAGKEGALMEQGLACERSAVALRQHGRAQDALPFIQKAITIYQKWGATFKVDQMQLLLTSSPKSR